MTKSEIIDDIEHKTLEDCDNDGDWIKIEMVQADYETIEKTLKCGKCGRLVKENYIYSNTEDLKNRNIEVVQCQDSK